MPWSAVPAVHVQQSAAFNCFSLQSNCSTLTSIQAFTLWAWRATHYQETPVWRENSLPTSLDQAPPSLPASSQPQEPAAALSGHCAAPATAPSRSPARL